MNKYGVIDKKGNFIITPRYDYLSYDSDSLFIVRIDRKYGWINKNNEMVIVPQFDEINEFFGNKLAPVKINGRWGYIDRKGQFAIDPQFDYACSFSGDYARVWYNYDKKDIFINQKGDIIFQSLYRDHSINISLHYGDAIRQKSYGFSQQLNRGFGPYINFEKRGAISNYGRNEGSPQQRLRGILVK
jgi:hypothetical protein